MTTKMADEETKPDLTQQDTEEGAAANEQTANTEQQEVPPADTEEVVPPAEGTPAAEGETEPAATVFVGNAGDEPSQGGEEGGQGVMTPGSDHQGEQPTGAGSVTPQVTEDTSPGPDSSSVTPEGGGEETAAEQTVIERESAEGEVAPEQTQDGGEGQTEAGEGHAEAGEGHAETGEGQAETGEGQAEASEGPAEGGEGQAEGGEGQTEGGEGQTEGGEGQTEGGEGEAKAAEGQAEGGEGQAEGGEGQAEGGEGQAEGGEGQAEGGEGQTEAAEGHTEGDGTGEEQAASTSPKPEGEDGSDLPHIETEGVSGSTKPRGTMGAQRSDTIMEGDEDEEEGEETEHKSPVPQSDSFAEGEHPEGRVMVGEPLSREGTPTLEQQDTDMHSPPVPGTPEIESGEEEEEEEEEDYIEEPQYDREQLIERYHQALAERQQFQEQNYQLQHKLAEYFRKKKSDDVRQEADKNVTDQEQRYLKYMANLDELRRQDVEERESYKQQIEELQEKCEEKQQHVDEERVKFMEFKREVGMGAVNSRSGRPIPVKDIEQYLSTENRKEAEVVNVRLENIKLRNRMKKKEQALKSKEELAEGLHLIDFEQLKIENQTYNEKIEERNEELLKLRKKITSTVQVLTHLKEKLQFVQKENQVQQGRLREVEELAAKKRDILSRTKQSRDALRIDNQRLRQNCGLLGNESLLRDFEERKDESEDLDDELERLKMLHAELTLNLNGVRKKIEQARAGRV